MKDEHKLLIFTIIITSVFSFLIFFSISISIFSQNLFSINYESVIRVSWLMVFLVIVMILFEIAVIDLLVKKLIGIKKGITIKDEEYRRIVKSIINPIRRKTLFIAILITILVNIFSIPSFWSLKFGELVEQFTYSGILPSILYQFLLNLFIFITTEIFIIILLSPCILYFLNKTILKRVPEIVSEVKIAKEEILKRLKKEKEDKRLAEEKMRREKAELTNRLKEILKYEKDHNKELNKSELIRIFKISIDDAEKYLNILNFPIKYSKVEIDNLKLKAEQVLHKFEYPTIYGMINDLDYDFETAKKLSKYLVDASLVKDVPRITIKKPKIILQEDKVNIRTGGLKVFLSYSTLDSDYFQISDISKALESYPEIDKILYWEADSGENIVEYMERTLKNCNVFVLFCSENAFNSQAVTDEWQAAFQLRKKSMLKIVPLYEDEKNIPALLTPLLNVKFSKVNFIDFIIKLYHEILRE